MSQQTATARRRPDDVRIAPIGRVSRRHRQTRAQASAGSTRNSEGRTGLATFLGYFSLGLGLAELLAPRQMAEIIGIEPDDRNQKLLRAMGAREFLNGVAVLASRHPEKAMWGRVSGDAADLACLGTALANADNDRKRTAFATANVLAVTAMDVIAASRLSRDGARA